MKIGKTYKFDAAHHLPGHPKCGRIHGHTYYVDVEVTGEVDPDTHMLIDYHDLDDIVRYELKRLDHELLNNVISYPTTESICTYLLQSTIRSRLSIYKNLYELRVRVREGSGGMAEDVAKLK